MNKTIFREYDIRGVVGTDLIIDHCYNLGKAIITHLKKTKNPNMKQILLARDGRTHSPEIYQALIDSFTDLGMDVIDLGIIPTPLLYFAIHTLSINAGIIVTASHNPKEYNGIKIWGIWGKDIQSIKDIFNTKDFYSNKEGIKGNLTQYDIITDYIAFMTKEFAHLKNSNIKILIDCGNGSAGTVMPLLINTMGWSNITLMHESVDGTFPNHEADPTVEKNMYELASKLNADQTYDLGIGFDGDSDRMAPMTKNGYLVPGDQLLALFAKQVVKSHPGCNVVFDIKASSSLITSLEKMGANPIISPTGHSLIKQAMIDNKALLAGELSCHFFFKDRYFGYDDAIYAAFRLIEILEGSQESLDQAISFYPQQYRTPEIRITCKTEEIKYTIVSQVKKDFEHKTDTQLTTIDGIRAQKTYGWGLVRASNTQPAISLRFESSSLEGINKIKQDFLTSLKPFLSEDDITVIENA